MHFCLKQKTPLYKNNIELCRIYIITHSTKKNNYIISFYCSVFYFINGTTTFLKSICQIDNNLNNKEDETDVFVLFFFIFLNETLSPDHEMCDRQQ